jgi:peptidoglycan/LPS O-acetylase OafA/YrhL
MAQAQYGAYLFHVPVVILVQFMIKDAALSPFAKFTLATALSVPLTFLLAGLLRKPALAKKIL